MCLVLVMNVLVLGLALSYTAGSQFDILLGDTFKI